MSQVARRSGMALSVLCYTGTLNAVPLSAFLIPLFSLWEEERKAASNFRAALPTLDHATSSSEELDIVWREAVILFIMKSVTASCMF